jgi:hypothetical protein
MPNLWNPIGNNNVLGIPDMPQSDISMGGAGAGRVGPGGLPPWYQKQQKQDYYLGGREFSPTTIQLPTNQGEPGFSFGNRWFSPYTIQLPLFSRFRSPFYFQNPMFRLFGQSLPQENISPGSAGADIVYSPFANYMPFLPALMNSIFSNYFPYMSNSYWR